MYKLTIRTDECMFVTLSYDSLDDVLVVIENVFDSNTNVSFEICKEREETCLNSMK